MAGDDETVSFTDCVAVAETEKALLVVGTEADSPFVDEGLWVPKSVVHDDSEVFEKGGEGKLVVREWWADKNGLT